MKKLTFILFIAIAKMGFAQQDTTLIYNSPMYTKDPIRSKWKPVVKQVGQLYQVTFYDRKDVTQEVISFEDKDLTVRKGPYLRYQKGILKEQGTYDKGHKNGEWTTYNSDGKTPKKVGNFAHGKLDGKYVEYWNGNKEEGNYLNGLKTGIWKFTYKDGKPAGNETYDDMGKKIEGSYYSKEGAPVKYEDLFAPPSYEGGLKEFYKYLATEVKYPAQSLKQKIEGTVKLSFVVKKNGSIENVEILSAPNNELANEAIRVLALAPDWTPGKMFGEVMETRYAIPVKFSLKK